MLNWIRYYLGTYFSNKQAKEAAHRSFWNVILSLFLFIIILTSFYTVSYQISFPSHYKNAPEFQEFIHEAFYDGNHSINLKATSSESLEAYLNDVELDKAINTLNNDTDKNEYSKNDYQLVIDTRDISNTYSKVDFVIKSDSETITDYEIYNAKSEEEKKNYTVSFTLTGKDQVLDESFMQDVTTYLTANYNSDFASISTTEANYNSLVYALYLKKKYNGVFTDDNLPTLEKYYTDTLFASDDDGNLINNKILAITKNYAFISFKNNKDICIYFKSFYLDLDDDYELINDRIKGVSKSIYENVDTFVQEIFNDGGSTFGLQRFLTLFTRIPSNLIMILIAALLMFLLCKFSKQYYCQTFMQAFKIIYSFVFWATIITGFFSFITSFLFETSYVMFYGEAFFLLLVVGRTFVLLITEFIKYRKNPLYSKAETNEEEAIDPESYKGNLDLSNVETGTKVIKNKNVKDDDEEHMEFM